MAWLPWLQCAFIAAAYVLPLHRGREASRDAPRTIFRRAAATLAVCCVAWVPLWQALKQKAQDSDDGWSLLPRALGLHLPGGITSVAAPLALTAALFLGPLALGLDDRWQARQRQRRQTGMEQYSSKRHSPAETWPLALRSFAIAPLTEEFAFRACMAPLVMLGGASVKTAVLAVPLFFGAAHLHHLYELVTFQRMQLADAAAQVGSQFLYTTVFGWYATWLFVRTGSLAAPVAVHAFCNWMGFPDFERLSEQPPLQAATAAGVVLFAVLLRPLTDPALFGGGWAANGLGAA